MEASNNRLAIPEMPTPFDKVGAAFMPANGLAALAALRGHNDIAVILSEDQAWVTWRPGNEIVWHRLLAVPGIRFFEERDGFWYELRRHIPEFNVPPPGEAKALDRVIFPAPLTTETAPAFQESPMALRLVASDRIHPTTAMRTTVAAMQSWVGGALTREISAIQAARCGDRVILRGKHLPAIAEAERFWGERVLLPLGFRAEPDLPETAIRAAAGASLNEILVVTTEGAEAVPEEAFTPLTRAGAKMAAK